jgi:hypothetical protein
MASYTLKSVLDYNGASIYSALNNRLKQIESILERRRANDIKSLETFLNN